MTTHLDASDRVARHDKAKYSTGSSEAESCSESGDGDTEGVLSELASCPEWDKIEAKAKESATVYPEPEGDDGSLAAASERIYTPINGLWQTRILQLLPGSVGSALHAKLIVVDIILRPGLALHKDQHLISYDALSYSCGEPILARRIHLQGESFPITENLYLGLQSIRKSKEPMFLWVDAICIHQADGEEKSQQVVNMLDIYRKADHVHVWLGSCGKNTGFALSFLLAAKNNIESHVTKCSHCLERLLEGIEDVFRRSWFRRTWVKQEIYAAKQIITHCGYRAFTGDFIQVWMASLQSLIERNASLLERQTRNFDAPAAAAQLGVRLRADHISIIKEALRKLRSFQRANPGELVAWNDDEKQNHLLEDHAHHSLDIINVMRRCSGSECSNLRDHVYALLGMTNLNHHTGDTVHRENYALIVDYSKSVVQIFEELTRYIIHRDQSLAVLCLEVPYGANSSQPHIASLPSWVPDLRFLTFERSWLQIPAIERACSDVDIGEYHLLGKPRPLHVPGKPSGRYLGGCDIVKSERRSLYEDTSLQDDRSGWISREDPRLTRPSALISPPTNRLRLIGRSVGSMFLGQEPAVADCFRFQNDFDNWNIFHEGHLNRGGIPAELLKSVFMVEEIEVQNCTLQSVSEAISDMLRLKLGSEWVDCWPTLPETRILAKIMHHRSAELLGFVSILVRGNPRFASRQIIVPPDNSVIAQCSYTDDLAADIEESKTTGRVDQSFFSNFRIGTDNFPASWLVPKGARSGDLILLVTGSPLPLLVRPRPSSLMYEFVGQAMPCQMTREDAFPSLVLHRLMRISGALFRPTEEFVLE
jgi:hypothetical protein